MQRRHALTVSVALCGHRHRRCRRRGRGSVRLGSRAADARFRLRCGDEPRPDPVDRADHHAVELRRPAPGRRRRARPRHAAPSPSRSTPAPPPTPAAAAPVPVDSGGGPSRIAIPAAGIAASVEPVGVTDDGDVEIPEDVRVLGWYRYSPNPPASAGSTVVVGHVDSAEQGTGAFFTLHDLKRGDRVYLELGVGQATHLPGRRERGVPEDLGAARRPVLAHRRTAAHTDHVRRQFRLVGALVPRQHRGDGGAGMNERRVSERRRQSASRRRSAAAPTGRCAPPTTSTAGSSTGSRCTRCARRPTPRT